MNKIVLRLSAAAVVCALGLGCTTAYDAYGNPRQVVEPGVAVLGVAAAGLLAYSLANNHGNRHHGHGYAPARYGRGYYGHGGYYQPAHCGY